MVDFDVLKDHGTTNERLRELFTAQLPGKQEDLAKLSDDEKKKIKEDVKRREKIEDLIGSRIQENITFALRNHKFYTAVDLAWDSSPINSRVIPLIMYAQNRIGVDNCIDELDKLKITDKYVKRNDNGSGVEIDLPKFFEVNINLVRSFITRRHAAQVNKFANLYPFFKYESRTSSPAGKLRADVLSQRVEIMADQFDYRHFQSQVIRDMLLYGHAVAFPRAAWEREVQWVKDNVPSELDYEGKKQYKSLITKDGVSWICPHPSRVFYDNNYPITSLNTDTGCEYVGFWDIARYGDIKNNPSFFNRGGIKFSTASLGLFTQYSTYFNNYYTQIIPPVDNDDLTQWNDRKNNVGIYSGDMEETSVFVVDYFWKMTPNQWGVGDYPHPIWVHLKVAGDNTVVFAEILPSSPAAVFSYNENDNRHLSISMAHELMPFQDQLTNLFSELLETAKADLFSVGILNTDIFPDNEEGLQLREDFRRTMQGENFYASTHVLEASFAKLADMGITTSPDNVFKVVRAQPNTQLTSIFQSISQLLGMVERLLSLSPQEQGQPAPREVSATEVMTINNTTESVYSFISESIDEGRAAMKRILYESLIAKGSSTIHLPVKNKYSASVIEAAGFQVDPEGFDFMDPLVERQHTVIGSKKSLVYDYIFNSRDGSERSSNVQAAQTLIQMFQMISQNQLLTQAMGKDKYFQLVNEISRKLGTDIKLEMNPDESNDLTAPGDQTQEVLQQLAQAIQMNAQELDGIKQALGVGQQPPQEPQVVNE